MGSSVLSVKNGRVMVDVCISDHLPCSRCVRGIAPSIRGAGVCFKVWRGTVLICCRFSDISILEEFIYSNRVVELFHE